MDRPVLIVVGGGAARRFGGDKLLARMDGRPVFVRALERLAPAAKRTVLVVPGGREAEFRALLDRYLPGTKIRCVPGGRTRPESVRAGSIIRLAEATVRVVVEFSKHQSNRSAIGVLGA